MSEVTHCFNCSEIFEDNRSEGYCNECLLDIWEKKIPFLEKELDLMTEKARIKSMVIVEYEQLIALLLNKADDISIMKGKIRESK